MRPFFTPTRLREGYRPDEVDDFLDDVETRLRGVPDPELAARIVEVLFTPVRLRAGYDMGEVDAYLDTLHRRAETGSAT